VKSSAVIGMRTRSCVIAVAAWGILTPSIHAAQEPDARHEARRQSVIAKLERVKCPYKGVEIDRDGRCILNMSGMAITNLTPLAGVAVDHICFRRCTHLRDLTPLKGLQLTGLNLDGTRVDDLSPLAGMPLRTLTMSGTQVSNLAVLATMPLTYLCAAMTPVSDLSPLRGMPLTMLNVTGSGVTDLAPVRGMRLERLHIGGTSVADLRPLKGMALCELFFDSHRITHGLEIIRSMSSLRCLGGGKCSTHFVGVEEFWKRHEHGHPVENWLIAASAGTGCYEPQVRTPISLTRTERLDALVELLGADHYKLRQEAEELLALETRDCIPRLRRLQDSEDPETRFRVRRVIQAMLADPSKIPASVYVLQHDLAMTPKQWRRAMAPWRRDAKVSVCHKRTGTSNGGLGGFAQSFVPSAARIAALELALSANYDERGWVRVDLCTDRRGAPSEVVLARTWLRVATRELPPHGSSVPIDLPDVDVRPGATYWITFTAFRDPGGREPEWVKYTASHENGYDNGKLLRPSRLLQPKGDVYFRIITDCTPVPLLRRATPEEMASLPKAELRDIGWCARYRQR
jgi:hypothetical protein